MVSITYVSVGGLTASNASEDSYACNCAKSICYADQFSYKWMTNSEQVGSVFTLQMNTTTTHKLTEDLKFGYLNSTMRNVPHGLKCTMYRNLEAKKIIRIAHCAAHFLHVIRIYKFF